VIPGAKNAINAWADEKTHGRIKNILAQEPPPDTPIVLANALYYLGDWEMPFDANDTWDDEFAAPSENVTTAFMHSDWSVPYYKNDDFSMITLNFKSDDGDGKYAMAFILPAEGSNVNDMLDSLNADIFSQSLESAEEQEVWIKLPKFEFSYFAELKDTLAAMGMQKALNPSEADFSAMTNEENEIYINQVLHKCYIRVDELGAEAAAVTAVMAGDGAAPIEEEPPKFYADRPFLFAIYSQEDGTIAFLGAVNDPTKE
jgi:serpin B